MADSKLATFKCDADLWEAFKARATESNTNASALLKSFMQAVLDGNIQLKPDGSIDVDSALDSRVESLIEQKISDRLLSLESRLGKLSAA